MTTATSSSTIDPAGSETGSLDLAALRAANLSRCARWHGPDSEPWTGSDWGTSLGGEAGEALNVVKKLRRAETNAVNEGDPSVAELHEMLAAELADVLIYVDLLAAHYDIDLATATIAKFNQTSARYGFPERLPG